MTTPGDHDLSQEWSRQWEKVVQDLTSDMDSTQLDCGEKSYRTGKVLNVECSVSSVFARFEGDRGAQHQVSIHFRPFPAGVWNRFFALLVQYPEVCGQLLQGDLPHSVSSLFEELGVRLLPRTDEVDVHCDCPNDNLHCCHIYALLLQLTEEIELNPLRLALFRGMPESIWFERVRQSASRALREVRNQVNAHPVDLGVQGQPAASVETDSRSVTPASSLPTLPTLPWIRGLREDTPSLSQHEKRKPVQELWHRAKEDTYWYGPLLSPEEQRALEDWDPLHITVYADARSQFAVHRFSKPPFPLPRQDAMTELRDIYRQVSEAAAQILKEDLSAKSDTDEE